MCCLIQSKIVIMDSITYLSLKITAKVKYYDFFLKYLFYYIILNKYIYSYLQYILI